MSEPGRFSLERLVADLPRKRATYLAAVLAALAAVGFGQPLLQKIPELIEMGYGYDAQLRVTVANRSLAMEGLPVTFVDVDDTAIRTWGNATRTMPREKLAEILGLIAKNQPKMIFLDFDLSGDASGDADQKFSAFLKDYPETSPPLLLTAEVLPTECTGEECKSKECAAPVNGSPIVEVGTTPFDKIVPDKHNVIWVSSRFLPEEDGVVRSWHLWDFSCEAGKPKALPSAQLAAAGLAAVGENGREKLDRYLKALEDPSKADALDWPKNKKAQKALIPFLIGGAASSEISDLVGASGFRYQRVHARSLVDDQVSGSAFKDRVVVLGASYGPDKFATPFGVMPGAALVANAIAVAPAILAQPPRHNTVVVLTLILALIYGAIAKTFRAILAAVVIAEVSYVCLAGATD